MVGIVGVFYYLTRTTEISETPTTQQTTPNTQAVNNPLYPKKENIYTNKTEPTVVKETLTIPLPEKITVNSGRSLETSKDSIQTPLVPQNPGEKVIISLATYTAKKTYDLAKPEAMAWKNNAQLSFIKSLGAITVDGKSSQWQIVFLTPGNSQKGYEIIVQGDSIVSKREVESSGVSADLPASWYDSDEALKRLAQMPQFVNTLVSGINFFYNPDAKAWRYAIATSVGTTSLEL